MFQKRLRDGFACIGQAFHEPEAFAVRWQQEETPYSWWVFLALVLTAAVGTTTYGMTMGLHGGVERMLYAAAAFSLAAGIAWPCRCRPFTFSTAFPDRVSSRESRKRESDRRISNKTVVL